MYANIAFNWAAGWDNNANFFFLLRLFLVKYFIITQVIMGHSLITFVKIMWSKGEIFEAQWKNCV